MTKAFMIKVSMAEFNLRSAMTDAQRDALDKRLQALHDQWVHSQACDPNATVDEEWRTVVGA